MYESGHSPSAEELRRALRRLEAALAEHDLRMAQDRGTDGIALALRRDLDLMREEAGRLRALLAP
ncbi:MAG TPA: hypothetical protein VF522_21010 [Ramlibacter sp.]|uniref:hypothetical protein n=1 Tax=Ramlibacter sp. TaxID=1917967 RepID=UPI002ED3BA7D